MYLSYLHVHMLHVHSFLEIKTYGLRCFLVSRQNRNVRTVEKFNDSKKHQLSIKYMGFIHKLRENKREIIIKYFNKKLAIIK